MNDTAQSTGETPVPSDAVPAPARSVSLGLVTREMCQTRARELAVIAERPLRQVWQADYLQAKRELTGETDPDLQDAILDSPPHADTWRPAPGPSDIRLWKPMTGQKLGGNFSAPNI